MASDALFVLPPASTEELVAFRWCDYDVPFWARENSRPGRWHRVGDMPTQYWSLSADAAWAELIRHQRLRTEGELDLVRMPFWACRVPAGALVDLRTAEARDRYGLTESQLVDEDWGPCQAIRPHLDATLVRGVIAPSAAFPAHANITLFGPRRAIKWNKRPPLSSTIPADQVSLGRPPEGLLDRVPKPASAGGTLF